MTTKTLAGALAAVLCVGTFGCGLGPKKRNTQQNPPAPAPRDQVYEPDLSKPDGPMLQMLRSAQERDEELFKASFAPSVNVARMDTEVFKKFRRKVLTNKLTPVPESVEQVSDTEAIVKLRSSRGREIPVHVQKLDGKWLITKIDFNDRAVDKFKDQKDKAKP
jgi:hypothetical protein